MQEKDRRITRMKFKDNAGERQEDNTYEIQRHAVRESRY